MEFDKATVKNLLVFKASNNRDREALLVYKEFGYKGLKSNFCREMIDFLNSTDWVDLVEQFDSGTVRCIVSQKLL